MGMTDYPTRSNNPMDAPHTDRRPMAWRGSSPDWTTTPPTEPGWYWVCETASAREPALVWFGQGRVHKMFVSADFYRVSDFQYWLGPLVKPEPPK